MTCLAKHLEDLFIECFVSFGPPSANTTNVPHHGFLPKARKVTTNLLNHQLNHGGWYDHSLIEVDPPSSMAN